MFRMMYFAFSYTHNCFLCWSTASSMFFFDMLPCVSEALFQVACIMEIFMEYYAYFSTFAFKFCTVITLALVRNVRRAQIWSDKWQRFQLSELDSFNMHARIESFFDKKGTSL